MSYHIEDCLTYEIPGYNIVALGFSCAEFFIRLLSLDNSTYISLRNNIPIPSVTSPTAALGP